MVDEALRGEVRQVAVAARQADTADIQLARDPQGLQAAAPHPGRGTRCSRWAGRSRWARGWCPPRSRMTRSSSRSARTCSTGSRRASTGRAASSWLSASPPHSALSPGVPVHPASRSICQVAGVACITVISPCPSRSRIHTASTASCSSARTTVAPVISGRNSSRPAMSKDIVVTASSASSAPSPGRPRIDSRRLVSATCGTSTPLGRPVEPEV